MKKILMIALAAVLANSAACLAEVRFADKSLTSDSTAKAEPQGGHLKEAAASAIVAADKIVIHREQAARVAEAATCGGCYKGNESCRSGCNDGKGSKIKSLGAGGSETTLAQSLEGESVSLPKLGNAPATKAQKSRDDKKPCSTCPK
jgi:hypothetical protein